ncbi:ABC transporter permease [Pelagibius marinus]|uniref:ABC transporter permease n=1 Tax=Pelagibius marinus TaxID=2762760 RepID=UPI001872AB2C|nr:ABC transporter permease [Pelagibius marinus]
MSELGRSEPAAVWREYWTRGRGSAAFVFGLGVTALLIAVALVSLVWTPHPIDAIDIPNRMQPPSADHWLGTDLYGRDVLSRLMAGAVNSIAVSLVAVGIGAGLGVPLGALAAARRGLVEEVVMRFNDFTFAFPALLSAVMITAVLGPGAINSIIAIGIFNIPVFARLTRGASLSLWKRDFVLAARVAGKGRTRITVEHILPNIASLLIVQMTIQFALAILAEAGLSYLGLGTQPPAPSWGKMLNEAQTLMSLAPHLAIFPGLAIMVTVLGLNLLGDGLRDLLDPRLRRQR